ncbi:MAG: Ig-like domain-containing protein, partial [Candidatus Binatia bacterium]
NGQIRYTSVFESPGVMRAAVDNTFATDPDAPAAGLSLYRFSTGHGGLQCQGCHGSTHAEYPSSHDSDNVQTVALQGHKGVLADCAVCHATVPATANGGPHGMHPIGSWWIKEHHDYAEHNETACKDCHGTDYRGTVLSRALGDRSFSTKFGTKTYFRGANVSCYGCHAGASSSSATSNRAPVVQDAAASTSTTAPVTVPLVASDADGNTLKLRIVSQPVHATVALNGNQAKYYPDGTFAGADTFTFAAYDGSIDSNLGTARITVAGTPPPNQAPVVSAAFASPNPVSGKTATLAAVATDDKGEAALVYTWTLVTAPAGGSAGFSANGTNAAKAVIATFSRVGSYLLRVTVRDADGATAARDVAVTVIAKATSVVVSPTSASVGRGGQYQFTASVKDQFAVAMSPQPAVSWTITGTNTVSATGLVTAGSTVGTFTVKATSSGLSGTATLSVRRKRR